MPKIVTELQKKKTITIRIKKINIEFLRKYDNYNSILDLMVDNLRKSENLRKNEG